MTPEALIAELESTLEGLTPGTLLPATRFRDLPAWDSLAALSTLAAVDTVFGIQISGEQLRQCHTIREIAELAKACKARA